MDDIMDLEELIDMAIRLRAMRHKYHRAFCPESNGSGVHFSPVCAGTAQAYREVEDRIVDMTGKNRTQVQDVIYGWEDATTLSA